LRNRPRAEVALTPNGQGQVSQSTSAGEDGYFQFDGVTPGKWALQARAHGFARQGFDEHQGYFTGIALGPGLQSEV
jgi:hypothetical protein